jgi:predicted DNA-binding transcriptional regulator AlpA
MKRPRTRIPEGESRRDKFVRLATRRMTALKSGMRSIVNLARYPHTDDQREQILGELRKMISSIEEAFAHKARDNSFSLKPVLPSDEPPISLPDRMFDLDQVLKIVPVSRRTIFRMMRENRFPKGVYITASRKAWFEDEIAEWQAGLPNGKPSRKPHQRSKAQKREEVK